MKHFFLFISLLFCFTVANAQEVPVTDRQIDLHIVNQDSVNLSLNENFELIEDSCSQIIRHARVGLQESKFMGRVTDVSKANPALVITDGYYNANGLKEGPFTTHFLNGKLQAHGSFKNGLFDGKWEVFYDDEKPRVTFAANGSDISITDAWDSSGAKVVENGKGSYRIDMDGMYWKGKLLNGKPDGSWKAVKANDPTEAGFITETFKNGIFQKGSGIVGAYTDSSRIQLVPADMLPFTHAELFLISAEPCNGRKRRKVVGAHYYDGLNNLIGHIQDKTTEALNGFDLARFSYGEVVITGEISTIGTFTHLSAGAFTANVVVSSLIRCLQRVPAMYPATVDGVPVIQKFAITYSFNSGTCRFGYRLLPVEVDK